MNDELEIIRAAHRREDAIAEAVIYALLLLLLLAGFGVFHLVHCP